LTLSGSSDVKAAIPQQKAVGFSEQTRLRLLEHLSLGKRVERYVLVKIT